MRKKDFIQALLPIWVAEIVLGVLWHVFGTGEVITLSATLSMMISFAFLPFIAGLRVTRFNGSVVLAVLGAASISVASILVTGISYSISSEGLIAFSGFVIATMMYGVLPQIIFGGIGYLVAKRIYAQAS